VRFALKFLYTFYVLAALILFLGVSSGRVGVSRAPWSRARRPAFRSPTNRRTPVVRRT
jgi:hypothetical protein